MQLTPLSYKNYMLFLLTLVGTANLLDRFVLSLVLEPIKAEFLLSDSQMGFLTGFAFAVFYAVAGIPIARWADRGNRNTIVTVTTGLWSVMVSLCGMVGNFAQLIAVRIGVAVGEAGCLPPAQSLIAHYFDRAERPRAMAIYTLCGPLAMLIGFWGGGWLVDTVGWRTTFIVLGVPGVFLALLVRLTLREPRTEQALDQQEQAPPLLQVLSVLFQQKTFRSIVIAFCISYFFGMGIIQWMPTFYIRSHAMSISEVGYWFAIAWGGFGLLGTYLGGVLATRYAAARESLQIRGCALVFVIGGIFYVLVYAVADRYWSLGLMMLVALVFPIANGAIFSAIQSLVEVQMRSTAIALIFLLANLIGFGLGPIAVGVLSDLLSGYYGEESLRYASMVFAPGYLWVAFFYWRASQTIDDDIQSVESISSRSVFSAAEGKVLRESM